MESYQLLSFSSILLLFVHLHVNISTALLGSVHCISSSFVNELHILRGLELIVSCNDCTRYLLRCTFLLSLALRGGLDLLVLSISLLFLILHIYVRIMVFNSTVFSFSALFRLSLCRVSVNIFSFLCSNSI